MFSVDCRNVKFKAPRRELVAGRFVNQPVSQLSSTDGKVLIQQVVAQFARLPLPKKSQTVSGELVLLGKRPDSVWRINLFTLETRFNPVEFDGIGISETPSRKLSDFPILAEEQEAGR